MPISNLIFGLIFIGFGVSWLTSRDTAKGVIQVGLGVAWLLSAAYWGRRQARAETGAAGNFESDL